MLRSFVTWLDDYLAGEDSSAVVKSVIGLMSFAVLLGVILGNIAVKLGALIAIILMLLSTMLILIRDRRTLKREANSHRELLTRYCNILYDENQPVALVKDWSQVVTIEKNGDVNELLIIRAVALRDPLYFLRLRADPKWDQPEAYRQRVRVNFRSVHIAGDRGPSWQVTPRWLPDGRLEMLAHLHSPIPKGTEILIEVDREWPGKCIPLMKSYVPDSFGFILSGALHIEHARYTVVLPKATTVYSEPIGFQQPNPNFSIKNGNNQDGRPEVTLTANNIPVDTWIGMRLQRK
ncbi:MAG TPA: hypothetical protein VMS31_19000 [Pyrinomonadaceae bacterium]|nr:hypothetical protein [Pyrinomonadaceae bacterium]